MVSLTEADRDKGYFDYRWMSSGYVVWEIGEYYKELKLAIFNINIQRRFPASSILERLS